MRKSILLAAAAAALVASPALAQQQGHAGHGAHAPAAGAQAQTGVVTAPSDGAMLNGSPERFSATFPHPMTLRTVTITPQGRPAIQAPVAAAAATTRVSTALPRLAPGNYTLAWTAQGADGHSMSGTVRFMVH
ncbi:copper resistance protein CopC [Brevundimonas sp. S1H14]|jgi:copper resistance protein C|uniref:copper resistance CopC family protein n=1 Tax=Brevundimonas TaxID=41275 RepID=UPI000369A636|nr:copper resistance CopC family protein [Brevundimonas diminuta]